MICGNLALLRFVKLIRRKVSPLLAHCRLAADWRSEILPSAGVLVNGPKWLNMTLNGHVTWFFVIVVVYPWYFAKTILFISTHALCIAVLISLKAWKTGAEGAKMLDECTPCVLRHFHLFDLVSWVSLPFFLRCMFVFLAVSLLSRYEAGTYCDYRVIEGVLDIPC